LAKNKNSYRALFPKYVIWILIEHLYDQNDTLYLIERYDFYMVLLMIYGLIFNTFAKNALNMIFLIFDNFQNYFIILLYSFPISYNFLYCFYFFTVSILSKSFTTHKITRKMTHKIGFKKVMTPYNLTRPHMKLYLWTLPKTKRNYAFTFSKTLYYHDKSIRNKFFPKNVIFALFWRYFDVILLLIWLFYVTFWHNDKIWRKPRAHLPLIRKLLDSTLWCNLNP